MEDAYAYDNCQVCDDAFDHTSTVEGVGLSLEFVQAHHEGELAGMETYRVYLEASEGDVLTSLSGNDEFALELNTTTSFYQHMLGGATPSDVNGAMLDMVPELAFDSYVTVGLTQAPGMGEEAADLMPGSWESAFEAGSSISVNDGLGSGWYTLPFASNGTIDEERPHLGCSTHHRRRHQRSVPRPVVPRRRPGERRACRFELRARPDML